MPADPGAAGGRILWLDIARTVALLAMAAYHTGFDLEMFGRLPPGTMNSGVWHVYARLVAGSFLAIAGASLYLAHRRALRTRAFLRRLAMIAGGAALVSAATYAAQGPHFAFFGILHSIALSSVVGLLFLRAPAIVTLAVGAVVAVLPLVGRSTVFDAPWLLWTGLSERPVHSVDFVPTFPWLAPVLGGIACARLMDRAGLWDRLRRADPDRRGPRLVAWPGQHSLLVYLVHQPILIGIVAGLVRLGLI
jgi:uncharacterized membrane protein